MRWTVRQAVTWFANRIALALAAMSLSACICTVPALEWSEPSVRLVGSDVGDSALADIRVCYEVQSVPGVDDGKYVVTVARREVAVDSASSGEDPLPQPRFEPASPEDGDSFKRYAVFDLTAFAPELDEGALSGHSRLGSTIRRDSFGTFQVDLFRRDSSSGRWIGIGSVEIGSSSHLPWRRIGVVTLLPVTVATDLLFLPFYSVAFLWGVFCTDI